VIFPQRAARRGVPLRGSLRKKKFARENFSARPRAQMLLYFFRLNFS
jgi:hypothetical protein